MRDGPTGRRPRSVELAEAAYRRGLAVLPEPLRTEHGEDAAEMFGDRARDAFAAAGPLAVLTVLVRALTDLALQAVAVRMPRRTARRGRRLSPGVGALSGDALRDARQTWRQWRRTPAASVTAVATLALGIGLTAAMFSVVHSVLLRPLPFDPSKRLVMIWERNLSRGWPRFTVSPANFFDWARTADAFDGMAAFASSSATLLDGGEPVRVRSAAARWNLFAVVGTPPRLGRAFVEAENDAGNDDVVILSHRIWSSRFGEDPAVVGRILTIDERPRRVVGVLPPSFGLSPDVDLWMPITFDFDVDAARGAHFLAVVASLAEGASVERAQVQLETIAGALADAHAASNAGWDAVVVPMREQIVGRVEAPVRLLFAAVVLVMLIAAANVVTLLAARGAARRVEFGVRRALGAGLGRMVRQLVVESTLLAVAGAAGGLGVAWILVRMIVALDPGGLPRIDAVGMDGSLVAFSGAIALAAGLATGVMAALPALGSARGAGLVDRLRGAGGGAGRRTRRAVVVAEIALALVLLIGWGLVGRSLAGLLDVDPGFEPAGLVTARVSPPSSRYPEASLRAAFYQRVAARLRVMPLVDRVGVTTALPLAGSTSFGFTPDREPVPSPAEWPSGQLRAVDAGYFDTVGIRILRGRGVQSTDRTGTPPVVVVNETLARMLDGDVLGQRIRIASDDTACPCEIVGVVADVRETALDRPATPVYYLPDAQSIWTTRSLVVRSGAPLDAVVSALRAAVSDVDPAVALFDVQPVSRILDARLAWPRWNAWLLGTFALLAMLLAAGGIYGVTSVVVTERVPELGVRLALGARPRDLIWLVEREVLGTALAGLLLGIGGAVATTRFLEGMLVNVSTLDAGVMVGASVLLGTVGAAGALGPARRAARVDPVEALREK